MNSIAFTPTSAGTFSAAIPLYDNAASSPQTIALSGAAVTASILAASPAGSDFGLQKVLSRSAIRTIQISNSTPQAIRIDSVTVKGSNAADFTIANNCGNSLPSGGTCSVYVVFSPQLAGARSTSITVENSQAGPLLVIPLSGSGVFAGAFEIVNSVTGRKCQDWRH
jgi:hypothetical protein